MANSNPPVKGQAFEIRIALQDFDLPGVFQVNPTIAAGDFKVDKDGAGLNNLATLPSVSPAGSVLVLISLSATEMDGDDISVVCIDQTSPPEWGSTVLPILTTA